MKATPEEQKILLELATLERTKASGLKTTSPEQDELNKLIDARDRQRSNAARAQLNVSDMELEIRRIQDEMGKMNRRIQADRDGLGAATDLDQRRDLEHDLVSAQRRISDLQQELKEAHDEVLALRSNLDRQGADLDELERKVGAAQRAVEAASVAQDNAGIDQLTEQLRASVTSELLSAYDEQREISGVGVAKLVGRTCGGCHLMLPPAAVSEIRASGINEMPSCPDCGTYLVVA